MSIVNLENKTILVTGAAGFIGSNLVKRIYQEAPSATVIGIDTEQLLKGADCVFGCKEKNSQKDRIIQF